MQDLEYWADRRVLVTGGASGIGKATIVALLELGADVIALVRDPGKLSDVAAGKSGTLTPIACDLADPDAVVQAFAQAGPLDIAINSAAVGQNITPVEQIDLATIDHLINVNFRALLLCMQREISSIRQRGRGGAIVNVSAGGGLKGTAGFSLYCATKHAVVGLTRSVAAEVAQEGIRVNVVCPGATDTPMLHARQHGSGAVADFIDRVAGTAPIGRLGKPEEIAEAILWLAGPHSSYVVGAAISADGGATAV
jgi:NAD(P)-dependent dehydrogenase (short-subunit alcohol dehydrogenase family)